jgi:AhpD family alkylhydroperoxidase
VAADARADLTADSRPAIAGTSPSHRAQRTSQSDRKTEEMQQEDGEDFLILEIPTSRLPDFLLHFSCVLAVRKSPSLSQPRSALRQSGMAHLTPLPARGAGLFVRFVYFVARKRIGRVPIPVGIMAHHRAILAAASGFELGLERARDVDVRLKELTLVKTASLIGCRFCIDIGSAIAHGHGVSEAKLLALPFHETSAEFSPLERKVLDYTVQMTSTPSQPDAALVAALERELGVRALVELTAAIAWENFRARFNHAVGAKEEGYSEGLVCLLPPAATQAAP